MCYAIHEMFVNMAAELGKYLVVRSIPQIDERDAIMGRTHRHDVCDTREDALAMAKSYEEDWNPTIYAPDGCEVVG